MSDTYPETRSTIEPPDGATNAPFIGNPILNRRAPVRRPAARLVWYVGAPLAVIVAGAAAFLVVGATDHRDSLLTRPPTPVGSAPTQLVEGPATPPVGPTPAPTAPQATEAQMSPVEPAVRPTHHIRRHAAAAADENAVDTSASAPMATPTPSTVIAPPEAVQPPVTSSPPVTVAPPAASAPEAQPPASASSSAPAAPTPTPGL